MSRTMGIHGKGTLRGDVTLPGDKSLSHRVAMLAAIAPLFLFGYRLTRKRHAEIIALLEERHGDTAEAALPVADVGTSAAVG